jgi:ABC-type nickel/cobalt efflux system permease component RcnA
MKRAVLAFVILVTGALGFLGAASPTAAHPLGNFSINTAAELRLYADAIHVGYVVDMAEIPSLQERPGIDTDGDGTLSKSELDAYAAASAPKLADGLRIGNAMERLEFRVVDQDALVLPGDAGLEVLRVRLSLVAAAPRGSDDIVFSDTNFEGHAGYHEVVVVAGAGVPLLSSTAPSVSPTALLTDYAPAAPSGGSRSASFAYTPGLGEVAPALAGLSAPGPETRPSGPLARFLDADSITLATLVLMLLVALAFGAVHALEPGHGKSIVAAYFIGARGSAWQAALLGLVVAVTHSVGVFAIAALVLFGSRFIVPETLYPWLTLTSGLFVFALGATLLASRLRSSGLWHHIQHRFGHSHEHHHDHDHSGTPTRPPWKALVVLGLVDGMVPTPSTLVVLLGAISLDRVELGMLLVVAFSTGMALVMSAISLAVLLANGLARRFVRAAGDGGPIARLVPYAAPAMPLIAALILLGVGSTIVVRGLAQVPLL